MAVSCPFIDPVLLKLGPVEIRWYGFMYLMGFMAAYFVIKSELRRKGGPIPVNAADDFLFYLIVGLLLGARIGYVIFYNLSAYLRAPWEIFYVWHGGMSFHGGLIGMVLSGLIFSYTRNANFMSLADIGALSAPIGLMLGRIGNFINCELYGRVTTVPWGIVFPNGGDLPRHPSQLYESFLEGLVLFTTLWILRTKTRIHGQLLAIFLMLYGVFRFLVEFVREPDVQLGFVFMGLTMGQLLCLSMTVAGWLLFVYLRKYGTKIVPTEPQPDTDDSPNPKPDSRE
jgi:phosphatidylglycerol:prolipoprotein diacylglycerol transferase